MTRENCILSYIVNGFVNGDKNNAEDWAVLPEI